MAKKKLPAWATWSPDDKQQPEQQSNSNEDNFLNVTKNFLINKDSQDPMVESKLVSQYNAFKKNNPMNLPQMYGGTAPNILTDSTNALSTKKLPTLSKPNSKNYLEDVYNGDKQLGISPLLSSKAPTWEKVLLTPLAAIGTVGDYLNNQLKNNDGTTTGNKFTGRLIDVARLGVSNGQVARQTDNGTTITTPMDTGNKLGNIGGDLLGTALSFGVGIPGLNSSLGNALDQSIGKPIENGLLNGTSKLGLDVTKPLMKYALPAIKTGSEFGGLNAIGTAANGGDAKDILKSSGEGFGSGALFSVGGKALGDIAKLPSFLKDTKNNTVANIFNTKFPNDTLLKPHNVDSNVLNKGNVITPLNKLNSVSEPNVSAKVVGLNDNFNPTTQNRKFIDNSVQNSTIAPKVMKDSIKSQPYIKINNQDTWDKALKTVEENPQAALKDYFNNKTLKSADDTAIGQALITKAIKENRISDANDLSIDLAEKLTKAGQTVQAASIFKRLTPEGMLQYASNSINRINQVIEKETGIKNKIKLSDDEANQILQGMKEYKSMPEGDAKNIKMAQVMQIINDKQPSSLVDKIRAARNISLLGNLKTNIRNVVGNEIMGAADNAANVVGTPIDKLISLKTGQRSEALPSFGLQAKGFAKGAKNALQDSFGGIKLEDLKGKSINEKAKILSDSFANPIDRELGGNGKFEMGNRLAFNNKPMRIAENLVGTTLKVGDNSFKQAYTDDVLNQLMKANKVDTPTDEMRQIAAKIADERTYQDTNSLSKFATGIKNLPQQLGLGKGRDIAQTFVDTLLPYTRTPANILKRGIEYTPAGVVEGGLKLNKLLKTGAESGNYDLGLQRQAVDRLSRGIVGTGIMAGGASLAKKGLLTGSAAKDKDMAAFDQQNGKQPYAVKVGNKYYDFSWAQPMSMPLSAGVQMVKGKNGQPFTNLKDAATNALTFYSDQPMLQSLQKLLGSQYDSKNIGQRALEAGLQLPNQFVPTALKQVAQMKDNNVKSTYSPNIFEKTISNPFLSKVPGLTQKLPTKIDTLGNEVKQYQGNNNFFNAALNPGNLTTKKNDKTTQMIEDIYNKTGSAIQVPRVAGNTITYTDSVTKKPTTIDLTGKEVQDFQKYIGEKTAKAYSDIAKSYDMSSNSDEANKQANELQSILTKIYNEGKQKVLENRNLQELQKATTSIGHHYTPGK